MGEELLQILDALEKPMVFASKNNYSNIDKVKNLDHLVSDLVIKALSLITSNDIGPLLRSLQTSFQGYNDLDSEQKEARLKQALSVLDSIRVELHSDNKTANTDHDNVKGVKAEHEATDERNKAQKKPAVESDDPSTLSIQYIKGVGPKISSLLAKRGIETVEDALFYFPRAYDDRRDIKKISELRPDTRATVMGEIKLSSRVKLKTRSIYKVVISDGTGILSLVWFKFNDKYMRATFSKGQEIILNGDVALGYRGELQIIHPKPEDIEIFDKGDINFDDQLNCNRIVPIYPLTEGIKQRRMRTIIKTVLDTYAGALAEFMPGDIIDKRSLTSLNNAVSFVHFPPDDSSVVDLSDAGSVYDSPPHKTLCFNELFLIEVGLALKKRDVTNMPGIAMTPTGQLTERLLETLPFELTPAQSRVIAEIKEDIEFDRPMNRLLQGDVGSGKTIVALISMLSAVESGHQAVLMAPTEILADQHNNSIGLYLQALGIETLLLKSALSKKEKEQCYEKIASGEAQVVIGTHALIEQSVNFKSLGLVVVDEQHRFGVMQRAMLVTKGKNPHLLIMTATPIPRTLALTVYGDLDVSVLDGMPPGRKAIKTKVYFDEKRARERAYKVVREEVEKGRQVYVVYPMIEESENPDFQDLKYATAMATELQNNVFPEFKVGLVHGRMKTDEKDVVMKRFVGGEIDILVATTVIEVGVDVPNATVMVVEHAERFGLTQLHQLRGRVGRSEHNSRCLLISSYKRSEDASKRLMVMEGTQDGFKIAEADLMIRGPGDFMGTKQSGVPEFRFANLLRDTRILGEARDDAFQLILNDPTLKSYPALLAEVKRKWGDLLPLSVIS